MTNPAQGIPIPLPPRLSMDEYLEFVEAAIGESHLAHAARQKSLEKRIEKPFRMTEANIPSAVSRMSNRG